MPEPLIYSPGPSHAAPSPSTCPSRPRACSLHLGRGGWGTTHTDTTLEDLLGFFRLFHVFFPIS